MKKFITELAVMNEKEVERIHDASVWILSKIGMLIPDKEILQMLEQNGALIDWNKQIARFPANLIDKALNGINKDFKKTSVYFDRHVELNSGELILWMCSMPEIVDLEKNVKRRGTHEDMIKGITVGNVLPNVGVIEPYGIPGEVPSHIVLTDGQI